MQDVRSGPKHSGLLPGRSRKIEELSPVRLSSRSLFLPPALSQSHTPFCRPTVVALGRYRANDLGKRRFGGNYRAVRLCSNMNEKCAEQQTVNVNESVNGIVLCCWLCAEGVSSRWLGGCD